MSHLTASSRPLIYSRSRLPRPLSVPMASQTITHRLPKDDPSAAAASAADPKSRRDRKLAMAMRGIRSLAIAIAIPAASTAASISLAGASLPVQASPSWSPPVWTFHTGSLFMSALLGLSAWLVWAEGGFHRRAEALPLYLAELVAALMGAPLLFGAGSVRPALVVCVAHLVVLFLLSQCFRRVNPIAADLIKLYLAWVSLLAVFNYKLM